MGIVLVVMSITILVRFLPREGTFTLQFDLGKPWKYSSLIADLDFPIFKSDKEIDAERDSMVRTHIPYFNINGDVTKMVLSRFKDNVTDSVPDISGAELDMLTSQIQQMYEKGVIDDVELAKVRNDSDSFIRLVVDNHATTIRVGELLTQREAYEKLLNDNSQQRLMLQRCNAYECLLGNVSYDDEKNKLDMEDATTAIPVANGVVLKGQKIIDRGEIVDQNTYNILTSYEKEMNRTNDSEQTRGILYGQILFVSVMVIIFFCYLFLFRMDYIEDIKSMLMLFVLLLIYPIFCYLCVRYQWLSVYVIPFAICPIFVRLFMDSRTAFFTHFIITLLCACSLRYPYEFIIVQSVVGFGVIASLRDLSSRWQLIKSALIITLASCITYLAMELMQDGDIDNLETRMYINLCLNGILLLFAYPLMWCVEKIFGLTSNVTLVELSNTNNDLLRQLSEVAPGTFQHSIQVGNLAADVASRIKAKPQLCRTGALYHDIGKMENPAFFVENQSGMNPHNTLSPMESARIVISHVTDGLKLAEKNSLPQIIKEFIQTHHGQGKCGYFYAEYKKEHPDEDVDALAFTYPGRNPFTREQAIVMMADTCEAASRSMTEYTEKSISELVNRLIDQQMEAGYFRDCPLTFRDMTIAKTVMAEKLKTIYHTRIKYPGQTN